MAGLKAAALSALLVVAASAHASDRCLPVDWTARRVSLQVVASTADCPRAIGPSEPATRLLFCGAETRCGRRFARVRGALRGEEMLVAWSELRPPDVPELLPEAPVEPTAVRGLEAVASEDTPLFLLAEPLMAPYRVRGVEKLHRGAPALVRGELGGLALVASPMGIALTVRSALRISCTARDLRLGAGGGEFCKEPVRDAEVKARAGLFAPDAARDGRPEPVAWLEPGEHVTALRIASSRDGRAWVWAERGALAGFVDASRLRLVSVPSAREPATPRTGCPSEWSLHRVACRPSPVRGDAASARLAKLLPVGAIVAGTGTEGGLAVEYLGLTAPLRASRCLAPTAETLAARFVVPAVRVAEDAGEAHCAQSVSRGLARSERGVLAGSSEEAYRVRAVARAAARGVSGKHLRALVPPLPPGFLTGEDLALLASQGVPAEVLAALAAGRPGVATGRRPMLATRIARWRNALAGEPGTPEPEPCDFCAADERLVPDDDVTGRAVAAKVRAGKPHEALAAVVEAADRGALASLTAADRIAIAAALHQAGAAFSAQAVLVDALRRPGMAPPLAFRALGALRIVSAETAFGPTTETALSPLCDAGGAPGDLACYLLGHARRDRGDNQGAGAALDRVSTACPSLQVRARHLGALARLAAVPEATPDHVRLALEAMTDLSRPEERALVVDLDLLGAWVLQVGRLAAEVGDAAEAGALYSLVAESPASSRLEPGEATLALAGAKGARAALADASRRGTLTSESCLAPQAALIHASVALEACRFDLARAALAVARRESARRRRFAQRFVGLGPTRAALERALGEERKTYGDDAVLEAEVLDAATRRRCELMVRLDAEAARFEGTLGPLVPYFEELPRDMGLWYSTLRQTCDAEVAAAVRELGEAQESLEAHATELEVDILDREGQERMALLQPTSVAHLDAPSATPLCEHLVALPEGERREWAARWRRLPIALGVPSERQRALLSAAGVAPVDFGDLFEGAPALRCPPASPPPARAEAKALDVLAELRTRLLEDHPELPACVEAFRAAGATEEDLAVLMRMVPAYALLSGALRRAAAVRSEPVRAALETVRYGAAADHGRCVWQVREALMPEREEP